MDKSKLSWYLLFIPSNVYLGCNWIQKDGYFVREGHLATDECYDTLQEAKENCIASKDCHAIATQRNVCGGKYRVSHGGPSFVAASAIGIDWTTLNMRAWEYECRGN